MSGWLVAVMIETAEAPAPVRHYFAVGHAEQAKAEWAAVDAALRTGAVATSPVGGLEPVEAVNPIPAPRMKSLGLAAGEIRALGWKHPRRWLPGG